MAESGATTSYAARQMLVNEFVEIRRQQQKELQQEEDGDELPMSRKQQKQQQQNKNMSILQKLRQVVQPDAVSQPSHHKPRNDSVFPTRISSLRDLSEDCGLLYESSPYASVASTAHHSLSDIDGSSLHDSFRVINNDSSSKRDARRSSFQRMMRERFAKSHREEDMDQCRQDTIKDSFAGMINDYVANEETKERVHSTKVEPDKPRRHTIDLGTANKRPSISDFFQSTLLSTEDGGRITDMNDLSKYLNTLVDSESEAEEEENKRNRRPTDKKDAMGIRISNMDVLSGESTQTERRGSAGSASLLFEVAASISHRLSWCRSTTDNSDVVPVEVHHSQEIKYCRVNPDEILEDFPSHRGEHTAQEKTGAVSSISQLYEPPGMEGNDSDHSEDVDDEGFLAFPSLERRHTDGMIKRRQSHAVINVGRSSDVRSISIADGLRASFYANKTQYFGTQLGERTKGEGSSRVSSCLHDGDNSDSQLAFAKFSKWNEDDDAGSNEADHEEEEEEEKFVRPANWVNDEDSDDEDEDERMGEEGGAASDVPAPHLYSSFQLSFPNKGLDAKEHARLIAEKMAKQQGSVPRTAGVSSD